MVDAINQIIKQWGIANPAEFYLGIAVCSGILFLLMIVGAMFTQRSTFSEDVGWRFTALGVASSFLATLGYAMIGSFLPFFRPDHVPPFLLTVLFVGNVLAIVGCGSLFLSIVADFRGFLRSPGQCDWAIGRVIVWRMPITTGLTLLSIIAIAMTARTFFM